MGRLLIFLFGVLLGASGVWYLYQSGRLQAPGQVAVEAPRPAPNAVELPPLPSAPAPGLPLPTQPAPMAPLPSDSAPPGAEPVAEADGAAPGAEANAAVAAASAVASQDLLMPVQGVPAARLIDTYTQSRGEGRLHDAIDIMAARGTPVLAVADGRVAKLFDSARGGLTVYQFDREEKLAYYYAHLDRYAPDLAEGKLLKRGDILGYVGSTGNANPAGPHLHFAVFVLGPEKKWWQGTAVNPYPLLGGR